MRHVEQIASPFVKNISSYTIERDNCFVFDWTETLLLENVIVHSKRLSTPHSLSSLKDDNILIDV